VPGVTHVAVTIRTNQTTKTNKENQIMKKLILTVTAFAAALALPYAIASAGSSKTIVGVATEAGQFKTLVAAVKAAGLVDTLNGTGPFTVFAPTDEAFAKLPAGTVEDLLKPENKEKLAGILTYHVLTGKVMSPDVKTMSAKTVNGKEVSIKVDGGKVMVGDAKVVKTDIAASNGVIHVIDTVLIP
jgi:uncharacterized surface protein with fasciclin (FAS1) repeats